MLLLPLSLPTTTWVRVCVLRRESTEKGRSLCVSGGVCGDAETKTTTKIWGEFIQHEKKARGVVVGGEYGIKFRKRSSGFQEIKKATPRGFFRMAAELAYNGKKIFIRSRFWTPRSILTL